MSTRKIQFDRLIADIEKVEQASHRAGFYITAQALNRAKNAAGWELSGNLEEAGKASRGDDR
jgi:hypothetical protein